MKKNTIVLNVPYELRKWMYKFAQQHGWEISDTALKNLSQKSCEEYPNVIYNGDYITGNPSPDLDDTIVSIQEWIELIVKKSPINIKLNDNYTAKCTKEGIEVGCQTFSWGIVEKLIEAKNELL